MKVVLINGQNHKGSTYNIGRMLAEKITSDDKITEVFLPKDMPEFCCGCVNCFMKGEQYCPHYDVVKPITDLIDASDVLIFTTPVYALHATGSMKALLDHYSYRWMSHRPEEKMFSKYAVCISTAAGSGTKSACKDITDSTVWWGVGKTYSYGYAIRATSWDTMSSNKKAKIEKKTNSVAKKILKRKRKVHPNLKTKLIFNFAIFIHKKGWNPTDATYWKERGWLNKKRPWK